LKRIINNVFFQAPRPNAESGRALLAPWQVALALILCLWLTMAAAAQQTRQEESLPLIEKWQGDFDGMAKRREIRALMVYSKTFYFLDQGRQRGATYDLLKEFEKFVNEKLETKTLKIRLLFIPVRSRRRDAAAAHHHRRFQCRHSRY
jgi:hypothetical protein